MLENYLALIMVVALVAIIADSFVSRYPAMQRQLYRLFFVLIYFLFLIRYYYGPDIWTYVPHYENIVSPMTLWHHPQEASFEWGYDMFCSILSRWGVSYWGMTAVITTLYFASLAAIFHALPKFRLLALASVILLDYNMIYAQNRQLVAVALFYFMVVCLTNRKYILSVILGIGVVLFHKTGFIPVGLTLIGALLYHQRQSSLVYNILIACLMIMMLIPVTSIVTPLLSALPLPESYITSIEHHLLLGRQFQMIALIYLTIMIWLSVYHAEHKTKYGWIAIEALLGLIIIVGLYQYYYFLARMRSYFAPFIIIYLTQFSISREHKIHIPYMSLISQGLVVLFFLYNVHTTRRYIQEGRQMKSHILEACTVFDLRHQSEKQIRDRQLKKAEIFWTQDYRKGDQNKL